jgi:hypothetical protein
VYRPYRKQEIGRHHKASASHFNDPDRGVFWNGVGFRLFAILFSQSVTTARQCSRIAGLQPGLAGAVFRDIAVRSNADVQLAAIRVGQQALGPVVVQCTFRAGQVNDLCAWRGNCCVASL